MEEFIRSQLDGTFMRYCRDGFVLEEVPHNYIPSHKFSQKLEKSEVREVYMRFDENDDTILMELRARLVPFTVVGKFLGRSEDSVKKRHRLLTQAAITKENENVQPND